MTRPARSLLLASSLVLLAGAAPPKTAKPAKTPAFAPLRDRYVKSVFRRYPVVATYLGASGLDPELAKLDGKLRNLSPAALRAEKEEWEGYRAELARAQKGALTEAERVDAAVMEAQLAFQLRSLERRLHERALDATLDEASRGVEWSLQGMTGTGPRRGTAAEWTRLAERIEAIPSYLKTAQANVRRGAAGGVLPDRRVIREAVASAAAIAEHFEKELPGETAAAIPEGSSALRERIGKRCASAAQAFRDHRRALLDLFFLPDGETLRPMYDRDRFAAGLVEYSWALRNNLAVTKTPQELFREGRARVAATLADMQELARTVAAARGWSDASLPAVFRRLAEESPKSDEELLARHREAVARLVAWGRAVELFAVPEEYALDVVFASPSLRLSTGAAYFPAPPLKGTGTGRFYLTPTGNDPARLARHPLAGIARLAAHEGFPGHDWHYKLLGRKGAEVPPVRWLLVPSVEDSTSMWADSMATEGWAFHAEELVAEARPGAPQGFYTPEERLFLLRSRLLREVRIVVDPGIHCGFLTFDEAVATFARNVAFVRGAVSTDPAKNPDAAERESVEWAQGEITRYSRWPTQAVTYLLGRDAITALRDEVVAIEGERFDARRFHEELLAQGTVPQERVRDALLAAARRRVAAP